MAHDGTGTGWDVAAPADTDLASLGAQEIRDLRKGIATRVNHEHETLATSSVGGEHKLGSAKAYSQNAGSSAPTLRPDGVTALTATDRGRISLIGNVLYHYTGTAWERVQVLMDVGSIATGGGGAYGSYVTLTDTPRVIVFDDSTNGLSFVVNCSSVAHQSTEYGCIKSSTASIVTYIVDVDGPNKKFRIKIGTTQPGAENTFRYSAFAAT